MWFTGKCGTVFLQFAFQRSREILDLAMFANRPGEYDLSLE